METSQFGERLYPRLLWQNNLYVDYQILCQLTGLKSTTLFRILKRMEVANTKNEKGIPITYKYLNRIYYLESFAFSFWKSVGNLK